MKKLLNVMSIFALFAAMTLGFASCQQQNQPTQPDQTQKDEPTIVGNWEVVTMDYVEDTGHGTTSTETYPGQGMRFVFTKDNLCTIYDGGGIQQGTYSVSGNNLTIVINEPVNIVNRLTIQELTASTLVLKYNTKEDSVTVYHCKRA